MSRTWAVAWAGVVGVAGVMPSVRAQDARPAEPPAETTAPQPAPADTKPTVTLVKRDESGKLVRLEDPAEEAAFELLELDDATRQKVNAMLAERARSLDTGLAKNLGKLKEYLAAQAEDNREKEWFAHREIYRECKGWSDRGSVQAEAVFILPDPVKDQYKRVVREYWVELIKLSEDEAKSGVSDGGMEAAKQQKQTGRRAALVREGFIHFDREIHRACQRRVGRVLSGSDALVGTLGLSAEQEAAVRGAIGRREEFAGGVPEIEGHRRLGAEVLRSIEPGQRTALVAACFSEAAGAEGGAEPSPGSGAPK